MLQQSKWNLAFSTLHFTFIATKEGVWEPQSHQFTNLGNMKWSWYEWEYAAFMFLIWPVLLNRFRSHVNLLLVLFPKNFLGPHQQEIESGKLGKCKNGTNFFCHHSEYGLAQTAQTAMKWKNDVVLFVCYVWIVKAMIMVLPFSHWN